MNSTNPNKKTLSQRTGIDVNNKQQMATFFNYFNKYIPLIISVFLCISFIFIAVTDTNIMTTSYFVYLILIILPIMLTYIFWSPIMQDYANAIGYKWKVIWTIIILIITIALIIAVSLLYAYITPETIATISVIRMVLYIIFIALLVYIIYDLLIDHANNTRGLLGFFFRLLLLIPQSIVATIKWLYTGLTVQNVVYLTIITILAIALILFLYWTPIMNYFANISNNNDVTGNNHSQLILKGPHSINNQTSFSIDVPPTLPNYTFSFWIYINNSPIGNTGLGNNETAVFKYGPGAPYITINNNGTTNMVIYPSQLPDPNIPHTTSPFSILTQKWNYLVIQYTGTVADLYVNCNPIMSIPIDNIAYGPGDNITLGNYKNINALGEVSTGAISNVMYYTTPLTLAQMNTQYELLSAQTVPNGF